MPQNKPLGAFIWEKCLLLKKLKTTDKILNIVSAFPGPLGSGKPGGLVRSFYNHGIFSSCFHVPESFPFFSGIDQVKTIISSSVHDCPFRLSTARDQVTSVFNPLCQDPLGAWSKGELYRCLSLMHVTSWCLPTTETKQRMRGVRKLSVLSVVGGPAWGSPQITRSSVGDYCPLT